MPHRHLSIVGPDDDGLGQALRSLRTELGVPSEFPAEVLAEADAAVRAPTLPDEDATDIGFVTIDPPGSRDLDQALFLERSADGYVVQYAIADVGAFVQPGGAIDREAQRRGETLYAPDVITLLHPPQISHDAGSLLPGKDRPALLWTIELDRRGETTGIDVRRAMVRSREQLDYGAVQDAIDSGTDDELLLLLREIGEHRQQLERERGGVSLAVPEQQVVRGDDGQWHLEYAAPLPVESWNAQLSLLTGMAAAELMLYAEIGILRTLPEPSASAIRRLRRVAAALGVAWSSEIGPDEFVRNLDLSRPTDAALVATATGLLRGAGYVSFDGGVPELPVHAGIGSEYAHATAPLRRLVDRYVGEICVALCADLEVPTWVRSKLPHIAARMMESTSRAHRYESGIVSIFEAAVLDHAIGQDFDAYVVEMDDDGDGGVIQLRTPAVTARCSGRLRLGHAMRARLVEADVAARRVRFAPTPG